MKARSALHLVLWPRFLAIIALSVSLGLPAMAQSPGPKARMTITAGMGASSCALMDDGSARCWGHNIFGALGVPEISFSLTPVRPEGLGRNLVAIGAGSSFACALRANGDVLCWGVNGSGQLGRGTTGTGSHVPTRVDGLAGRVVDISVGLESVCALLEDGRVQCWGNNGAGQLGDGTTTVRPTPVFVQGLNNVVQISTSLSHSCALRRNGSVFCWGGNWFGQLGDGSTTQSFVPVRVRRLPEAVQIGVGSGHGCALTVQGQVQCWGLNANGELGRETETTTPHPVPRRVTRLSNVVEIAVTDRASCGRRENGAILCWGFNQLGRLGDGDVGESFSTPRRVAGLGRHEIVQMSIGATHSCALSADARMWC